MPYRQRASASPWPRDWLRRPAAGRKETALERELLSGVFPPAERPARHTVELRHRAEDDRNLELKRCEGFLVESPRGEVGFVECVRFLSSAERPDEIEIRVGRLRPELIAVPVADVEHVSLDDESVRLSRDPRRRHHYALRTLAAHLLRIGTIP